MSGDDSMLGVPSGSGRKRTFIEALKELTTQQTIPNAKRISVDAKATDTIRVEVNKVPNLNLTVSHS